MAEYLYWCGVALNVLGVVAVVGWLLGVAVDKWIRFTGSFIPMVVWYAKRNSRKKKSYRTGDGY